MPKRIHIGVFAHNQERRIAAVLDDLVRQDVFAQPDVSVRIFVLANGCTDATVRVAAATLRRMPAVLAERVCVLDLPLPGKSRTWNHFVHELCVGWADFACFVDADIRVPDASNLARMLHRLESGPACVVSSRPRKDIELTPAARTLLERIIVLASRTAADCRNFIAGSLYLARTTALEGVHMPVGLPIQDGFLRAMILTRLFTEREGLGRIHGEARKGAGDR